MEIIKKILPYKYPQITCYTDVAGLFSILDCHEITKEWIYSNYIQLQSYELPMSGIDVHIEPSGFVEEFCPYIICAPISRETVKNLSDNIVEFFIKCIDSNNYIHTSIDQYYISNARSLWKTRHLIHSIFIIGYDLQEQVFYAGDFTFTGKFSYEKIRFDEMEKAFKEYDNYIYENDMYFNRLGVSLWRFTNKHIYHFDVSHVKKQLTDYINGNPYCKDNRIKYNEEDFFTHGMQPVYNKIINHMSLLIEPQKEKDLNNHYRPVNGIVKCLHNIFEHKKLMLARIEYMSKNGFLDNSSEILHEYEQVVNKTIIISNNAIKYRTNRKEALIDKMITSLNELAVDEKLITEKMIHNMRYK